MDVSDITNLEGLLATFQIESPDQVQEVASDEQLVYLFDLTREPFIRRVQVEVLVGNDYHIEVATLSQVDDGRTTNRTRQFTSTFYRTVLRAGENVHDLSNLRRVRFGVGEQTGLFTYSADMHLELAGVEIAGEYARSALYSRFPARQEGKKLYGAAPSFAERGAAYYINGRRWLGRARVGAEYFSVRPDYRTTLRTYEPTTFLCCYAGRMAGMVNSSMYWDLIQDNEDGDRYPDRSSGDTVGQPQNRTGKDPDGVDVGLDADRDGLPDTNRNRNAPFPTTKSPSSCIMSSPTTIPMAWIATTMTSWTRAKTTRTGTTPYDHDQRGFHLFGQVDLSPGWSAAVGRYQVGEVAGSGRNQSSYALLTYRRQGMRRSWRLFFENHLRRVKDDIADEYNTLIETATRFTKQRRADPLLYEDSYVNESYCDARLNPWSTLQLMQKVRLRLNWQQGGELRRGIFQRGRRLDHWTLVSRVDYTYRWSKLSLTPQFKIMLQRLRDQDAELLLRAER